MNEIFDPQDVQSHKGIDVLMSVFTFLFFVPLVANDMKNSPYLQFRANQCLILFILNIGVSILSKVLGSITIIGFVLGLVSIVLFVFWIMNIVNAASGNCKKLPVVGDVVILK